VFSDQLSVASAMLVTNSCTASFAPSGALIMVVAPVSYRVGLPDKPLTAPVHNQSTRPRWHQKLFPTGQPMRRLYVVGEHPKTVHSLLALPVFYPTSGWGMIF
jgi:hypothetical protein